MELLQIAKTVTKPARKRHIWNNKGATKFLDANRSGIVKMRQRKFTWGQIAKVLEDHNYSISYNNLYSWQRRAFKR